MATHIRRVAGGRYSGKHTVVQESMEAALGTRPAPRCLKPGYPFSFPIMWLMTCVCSRWGLNMMISASASTFTLCPGGQ